MDTWKSYLHLWEALATTLPGSQLSKLSLSNARKWAAAEGLTFFEQSLPVLSKSMYTFIETGVWPHSKRWGAKPEFLRELLAHVRNSDGTLRESSVRHSTLDIRKFLQLTGMFGKMNRASHPDIIDRVVSEFADFQECHTNVAASWDWETRLVLNRASTLLHKLLAKFDPFDIEPRHGPGATYNKTKLQSRWQVYKSYPTIEDYFPMEEYGFLSLSHLCDELDEHLEQGESDVAVRLVTVPKTSEGPRLIAVEHEYPQFIKLGIMDKLYNHIQRHPLTAGYVNFNNQDINRELAKIGSIDKSFCTIDLSSASDSVLTEHIEFLFPRGITEVLLATRAEYAEYGERVIPLNTFATMGSALCFPIEALVFWAIARAAVGHSNVTVYGDDIICPNADYSVVSDIYSKVGFSVNDRKSYHRSHFRESCGGDYLYGDDVSIVRFRQPLAKTVKSRSSYIEFCNLLSKSYGINVGRAAIKIADEAYGYIPRTDKDYVGNIAFYDPNGLSANDVFLRRRWSKDYHRYEYKLRVVRPMRYRSQTTPWFETFRSLMGRGAFKIPGTYDSSERMVTVWMWAEL